MSIAVVTLLEFAFSIGNVSLGGRHIGDRVAIDPDVLGALDADCIVGRVPVPPTPSVGSKIGAISTARHFKFGTMTFETPTMSIRR